jgi:hypothetical protein
MRIRLLLVLCVLERLSVTRRTQPNFKRGLYGTEGLRFES